MSAKRRKDSAVTKRAPAAAPAAATAAGPAARGGKARRGKAKPPARAPSGATPTLAESAGALPPGREIHRGRVVWLRLEPVALPNGTSIELEVVRHPGAAAVVPLDPSGNVLLIRQYRHAAGGYIYEVPAGKLDAGEAPEVCAVRELAEEAGVSARRLDHLGSILTTPGFSDEVIHLFLARDLTPSQQRLESDEVLSVERVALTEALRMCQDGRLRDAKSMCALLLAERFLAPPSLRGR